MVRRRRVFRWKCAAGLNNRKIWNLCLTRFIRQPIVYRDLGIGNGDHFRHFRRCFQNSLLGAANRNQLAVTPPERRDPCPVSILCRGNAIGLIRTVIDAAYRMCGA